jgi:predicted nucleic acid-binding protein
VVDASVAIKWYIPEIHADAALGFLDDNYDLVAPDLVLAEFGNIVWKKCRSGEIAETEAYALLAAFEAVPLRIFYLENLLKPAFELAIGLGRTVYDCLYLALAVHLHCRMVTADRRFYDVVEAGPYAGNIRWVDE